MCNYIYKTQKGHQGKVQWQGHIKVKVNSSQVMKNITRFNVS